MAIAFCDLAWGVSSQGPTGRTNTFSGTGLGCGISGGCHNNEGPDTTTMTVNITGPAALNPGQPGNYTVTASRVAAGTGTRMGVNIASTGGLTALSVSPPNLMVVSGVGEIVHTTNAGTTPLTTTTAGIASYSFTFTMPANAIPGGTATIYAVSRLGFSSASNGGWRHANNFNIAVPAIAPSAPTGVVASAANSQATVTFVPSASSGGSAILSYRATSTPGNVQAACVAPCTSINVGGLNNGTAYTFTVHAHNAVGDSLESSPSNSVTPQPVPGAPTSVVATPGNTIATVTFAPPASGSAGILKYDATSSPGGFTGTCTTPCSNIQVGGLSNGVAYRFTVTATNASGTGPASALSNIVTPSEPPSPPRNMAAVPGNATATVTFAAPVSNGGSAITGYTVISVPAGGVDINAGSTTLSHTVTGLYNGVRYMFYAIASNAAGSSTPSLPYSREIVPIAATLTNPWNKTLTRTGTGQVHCFLPRQPPNPFVDTAGNVFVNGCSLDTPENSIITYKLGAATGNIAWSTVYAGVTTGTYPFAQSLSLNPQANPVVLAGIEEASGPKARFLTYSAATGAQTTTFSQPGYPDGMLILGNGDIVAKTSDADSRVVKMNAAGQTLWSAVIEYFDLFAADAAGNVYVHGAQMRKLDSTTGNPLWNVAAVGARVLAVAPDGSLIAAGPRIYRIDSGNGAIAWSVQFNDSGVAGTPKAVAFDNAGYFVVTGTSNDPDGTFYNYRTVKYPLAYGAPIWNVRFNGPGGGIATDEYANAVAIDPSGNVIVTGSALESSPTAYRMRTIKYNGIDGGLIWTQIHPVSPEGFAVAIGPGNSVYAVGRVYTDIVVQKFVSLMGPDMTPLHSATPGDGKITLEFSTPAYDGGSAITGYTARCGNNAVSGSASPLVVSGLTNGQLYSCRVFANNAVGAGIASEAIDAIPSNLPPLALLGVESRKSHAGMVRGIVIAMGVPATGAVTVEPRVGAGQHLLAFTFNNPILQAGTVSVMDEVGNFLGNGSATPNGSSIDVLLPAIVDGRRVRVLLNGVNGGAAFEVALAFVAGDVTRSMRVNAADIASAKARIGQALSGSNVHFDVNVSGGIDMDDVRIIKTRSGR